MSTNGQTVRNNLFSMLNLHLAGVGLLLLLNLFLIVRLFIAWRATGSQNEERVASLQFQAKALEFQNKPLRGLGEKVDAARADEEKFAKERIPATYSQIAGDVGDLAVKNNVRLTRVQYTATPAPDGSNELRLDASLSGEYPSIVRFINGLERDKTFFLINALRLTGQQGGQVNLSLRVTTYLHAASANDLPPQSEEAAAPAEKAEAAQ